MLEQEQHGPVAPVTDQDTLVSAESETEEARLAAEEAAKEAERVRRAAQQATRPAALGLKDLKAALEARTGGK